MNRQFSVFFLHIFTGNNPQIIEITHILVAPKIKERWQKPSKARLCEKIQT